MRIYKVDCDHYNLESNTGTKENLKPLLAELLEQYEASLREGYDDGGELEMWLQTALKEVRRKHAMYN